METWNRNELYVEVWERPQVKVAAKYGISAVMLGKVCRKLHIPLPGRGYWAKLEFGKPVEVGNDVWIGGGSIICPGVTIGPNTVIGAGSVVTTDVPARSLYSGYPAVDNRQWLKTVAALNRLPELQKRVRELESELDQLKARLRMP